MIALAPTWPKEDAPETAATATPHKQAVGYVSGFLLPSADVSISAAARGIFETIAPTHTLFMRGGKVHEISEADGELILSPITSAAFASRIECYGKGVFAWRTGAKNEPVLKPTHCSGDVAKLLLETIEAGGLPQIESIVSAPVLSAGGGDGDSLGKGYHAPLRLFVAKGETPLEMELCEAKKALLDVLSDFDFVSPGDHARAVASLISPALKFGNLLPADFPLDLAEANESQSGKTYRQKLVCAIYGERARVINRREGGVGGLDESISSALVEGRPFIALDNVRGRVDSQILESALRGHGHVPARVPHRGEVSVNTARFLWQLSSNGAETTRDLANRAVITRIRKRSSGYPYKTWPEGSTLEHITARQSYYLGAVFSIVKAWIAAGAPRTNEHRHDFREWVQTLDWICQKLMGTAPLLDGHREQQERAANPALGWLRQVALAVNENGDTGRELSASAILELCELAGIDIPGSKGNPDVTQIGRIMAKLFREVASLEVDGFTVSRTVRTEYDADRRKDVEAKRYQFQKCAL